MSVITAPWERYGVTQGYGPTPASNPFGEPVQFGAVPFHDGIDFNVPCGTPVAAPFAGAVTFAGWDTTGYGNKVMLQRADGYQVFYAHLSVINVGDGQAVNAGDLLGQTGTTGNSTGCHLHLGAHTPSGWTLDLEAFPDGSGGANPPAVAGGASGFAGWLSSLPPWEVGLAALTIIALALDALVE